MVTTVVHDPPVGTVNLDGGRNPEIYVGNGEWQPLDGCASVRQ
jgi:hypothetical protein